MLPFVVFRRLWIAFGLLTVVVVVTGCGSAKPGHATPSAVGVLGGADAENNGAYVQAGAITYQLQISRELNPYSVEDSPYVKGLPAGYPGPTANQEIGVPRVDG